MKLFPKLAATTSVLLLTAVASMTLCIDWIQEQDIREEAGRQRQAVLDNVTHIAEESFLTNDDLMLVKYIRSLARWDRSLLSVSVVNPQGAVLAHSEPSLIGTRASTKQIPEPTALVLSAPIRLGTHWAGSASVAFSAREFEERIRARHSETRLRAGEVAMVSLLLGLIMSFALTSSWTRPIEHLVQVAQEIGEGKWDCAAGRRLEQRKDEIGLLSQSFKNMAAQLKQLDVMKEDFVSAVTHELRSPLGAIESYADLISDEIKEGVPLLEWALYLERIRINTRRLTHFVNDLLDVAALERGKIKMKVAPFDLHVLAQDASGFLSMKLKEKGLIFELSAPSGLPEALGDADKIRQVINNLLSNAIKFTSAGGRISLTIRCAGQFLQVSVKDSGIGIARADQTKIFNKFEQVRSARQSVKGAKGTGLGLSISRGLIEMHQGALWVESESGKGSLFHFTVPIAQKSFEKEIV